MMLEALEAQNYTMWINLRIFYTITELNKLNMFSMSYKQNGNGNAWL